MNDKNHRITEGVLLKEMILFLLPLVAGSLFQLMYNTVDAIIVGRFVGKEALSAVGGTTGTLINLFVNFFVGMSSGCSIIISQQFGGRRYEDVSKSVHTAFTLALIGGAVIAVFGLIFAPSILRLMGIPEDIFAYASSYIRIYFCGMIFNLTYNMGAGILRAIGDSKRPLYFLIVSSITNIVLDLLFVVVLGWAVNGVAIATILSQCLSMIMVCFTLGKTKECYRLEFKKLGIKLQVLSRMLKLGLPAGCQSLMYSISNLLIQACINGFGTDVVAGWTVYVKLDAIFWTVINCVGIVTMTFAGQNFGAGYYKRVRQVASRGVGVCLVISLGISLILNAIPETMSAIFTTDQTVISLAVDLIRFLTPFYFTFTFVEVLSAMLRGLGNALIPMIITCCGVCVLRVVWITFVSPGFNDIHWVVVSYPITWIVTSVLFLFYYPYYMKKHEIR